MKKMLNTSRFYFIFAILAGVFHREFTKFHGFSGKTSLGFVHGHLFVFGMLLFLIISLFCLKEQNILQDKTFKRFYVLYNIALPFMAIMMLARGILQVQNAALTRTADAMLSGIAGISHILITVSLWMLFTALLKNFAGKEKAE